MSRSSCAVMSSCHVKIVTSCRLFASHLSLRELGLCLCRLRKKNVLSLLLSSAFLCVLCFCLLCLLCLVLVAFSFKKRLILVMLLILLALYVCIFQLLHYFSLFGFVGFLWVFAALKHINRSTYRSPIPKIEPQASANEASSCQPFSPKSCPVER